VRALADSAAGMTRAELASAAAVSLPTLDRALRDLREEQLLEEDITNGRLQLGRAFGLILGVDIGRAHRRAGLASPHGALIGEPAEPTTDDVPEQFTPGLLVTIAELIEDAIERANEARADGMAPYRLNEVRAITVGIPYPVSPDGITVGMFAPKLSGLKLSKSLRSLLASRADARGSEIHPELRIWFARDADLGALAVWREHLQEHPVGSPGAEEARQESLVYLKASHGIDAGIICHGLLVTGARGLAGQVGHMWIPHEERRYGQELYEFEPERDNPGTYCPRCKRMLCVENIASGEAIVKLLERSENELDPPRTVARLVEMLNSQQTERVEARAALTRAARTIGVVLADAVRLADPTRIVVGGLLALTGETFITPLRIAFAEAGLRGLEPEIVAVAPEEITRIELRGAIAVALKKVRFG
jgi:predicted NBD/HSP70 family sugar kinase